MYGWYSLPFAAWFLGQSRGSCTGGVLGQGHTEQHHRMLEFATIEIHIIYIHMCVCVCVWCYVHKYIVYRIHHKRFIRMRRVSNKTCRFAFELEARATRKILKDDFAQGMARTSWYKLSLFEVCTKTSCEAFEHWWEIVFLFKPIIGQ